MTNGLSRREFLEGTAGMAVALPALSSQERGDATFRFVALGDLHFDRWNHHDHEWLAREKPNDVRQVQNYSRITAEVLPALFAEVREQITADASMAFVAHIGDFVEGLAGTPELARKHCREAVEFVREARLGRPFVFVKGNHDITGPGAVEAFNDILLPFVGSQLGRTLSGSSFVQRHGNALFVYYDAYDPGSLDWLEKTLAERKEKHLFFVIHPPVVPYSARSNWHLFARPEQAAQRERLLNLLGKHRAVVLCGHLHKYGTVVRHTPAGPFVQIALLSVLPDREVKPKDEVRGLSEYGPELVRFEAGFSPDSRAQRQELLIKEKPHIRYFEYADTAGYGIVSVSGEDIGITLYNGTGKRVWRTLDITQLLRS
ncbi:MAG: metallophosphoesterase [Capsulimonadales bacterium]|nr:metallophosphoesterase [Capsulimonadales bacterium]